MYDGLSDEKSQRGKCFDKKYYFVYNIRIVRFSRNNFKRGEGLNTNIKRTVFIVKKLFRLAIADFSNYVHQIFENDNFNYKITIKELPFYCATKLLNSV